MMMAMLVAHMKEGEPLASLGSPGLDRLEWLKPVYPGDTLSIESKLVDKRRSKNRPEMGITKSETVVLNQHGDAVMRIISNGLVGVREPDAGA
jgi:acyl dehydratase